MESLFAKHQIFETADKRYNNAMSIIHNLLGRFGYKLVRKEKFPQGDLLYFFNSISNRGFKPQHILDVGANKGVWSRAAKKVFPYSKFTLVEPQFEMAPYLDQFCLETPGSRWINAGAGATEGELLFTIVKDTVSSSFAISEEEALKLGLEQRSVPVVTLDSICRDTIGAIPDMVKLDVEGFEYEVLKGSETLLGKSELILVEIVFFGEHKNAKQVHEMFGIMNDYGYKPYDFTSFEHRPYDGALGLCEIAFARRSGFLRSHEGWR